MTENLAWELDTLNLMKSKEHSSWALQDLRFEVEIPLALEVFVAVDERKLAEQEVELVVDRLVGHAKGVLELLRENVVLGNAEIVQQWVEHLLLVEKAQMDH